MLPEALRLCRRLNPGGGPGTQNLEKSQVNANVLEASAKLPHTVAQSCPQGCTGYQNGAPKLTFEDSKGHFFLKMHASSPLAEPCYLLFLYDI